MRNRATRRLGMDMFMMLFLAMGAILYMILPLINIPEKDLDVAPPPQGNVVAELFWRDDINSDVDLWVQAPGDVPVGYSNKGGIVFNLLRDDLGSHVDISKRNMEVAYSRGVPNGEYVINAHLFSLKSAELPVSVRLVISYKKNDDESLDQLFAVTGDLIYSGQEKTLARFTVVDGKVDMDSFGTLKKSLRALRKERRGAP